MRINGGYQDLSFLWGERSLKRYIADESKFIKLERFQERVFLWFGFASFAEKRLRGSDKMNASTIAFTIPDFGTCASTK